MTTKNSTQSSFPISPITCMRRIKIMSELMFKAELVRILGSQNDNLREKLLPHDQEYQEAIVAFAKATRKYHQVGRPLVKKKLKTI